MPRSLLLLLPLAFAGCAPVPPNPDPETRDSKLDPRLQIRILYVLDDGGVFRYDELASAPGQRNFREIRTEHDDTFTRYSFTLHAEGPDQWWTSL